jgi:uncharacterized protein (TIGR02145 family)
MNKLALTFSVLLLSNWNGVVGQTTSFYYTDPRDNQPYAIVKIANTWWFAENLNFYTKSSVSFSDASIKSGEWGRHYTFEEKNAVYPPGWRLPGLREWQQLGSIIQLSGVFAFMDGRLWHRNKHADNSSGLSLLPSGFKHKRRWSHQYFNASYWFYEPSQTEKNWHLHIDGENNMDPYYFHEHENEVYKRRFTIRCVCEKLPQ